MILSSWLMGRARPLRLFGPPGVIAFSGGWRPNADILVQCCYLARSEIASPQTRRLADSTLACADTVGRIATEAKVGTLVLTHHRPKSDELLEQMRQDVARDFAGPLLLGHDGLRVSL